MDPNPYEPPSADDPEGSVDRPQRDGLADTIRQFLNEEISAFEFDRGLDDYRQSTDPTVRFVSDAVWYHYDDCTDHMVTLSKQEWDYFQRLLLLLGSDGQITVTTTRRWSWTQILAFGCLIAFAWCIWRFGWGQHLFVFAIPFGLVSIFISYARYHTRPSGAYDRILTPFANFAELSVAYRANPAFAKHRYPRIMAKRRIRSALAEFGVNLQMYAAWLLLSPIPLLFQTLPITETRTSVQGL